jgi:hypothetical protein
MRTRYSSLSEPFSSANELAPCAQTRLRVERFEEPLEIDVAQIGGIHGLKPRPL